MRGAICDTLAIASLIARADTIHRATEEDLGCCQITRPRKAATMATYGDMEGEST
jgi:hypothetical protein